ncbi:spermidine synthase [Eleftheria terrae]|uniref:spermidine synthase n=1 Tax=Eleftheria terrae TaxID=1597781 RepID=UPI00263AFD5B|nr:hypothetical protein [Eleftheria terrae]WKB51126.1 hypothetical protein N7L95_15065 [Eleftheria terrae]
MSMNKKQALALSFGVGFLSLSQEILWVRFADFLFHGAPQAFAFVLGLFLLGIAVGATAGKRACATGRPLAWAGIVLAASAALDLALPQLLAGVADSGFAKPLLTVLVLASAALKGAVFPIAHHVGSQAGGGAMGRSISRVYLCNILGSTLGPVLTGFVLLDHVSLTAAFQLVGIGGLLLASLALAGRRMAGSLALLAVAATMAWHTDPRDPRLVVHAADVDPARIRHVVETRHGIVHSVDGGTKGDVVYGGNVYDGRTNTDLAINSNMIDRVYLVAGLHPAPKRVLVIGLSTGAWTRVLAGIPSLERLDAVEINPGYLQLISQYPEVRPILQDPKVHIVIDDGRRWLRRHPAEKYDLIVMNTSFHWRGYITNLLSQEFMALARAHLAPGGVFAFNTTGSVDAWATAGAVFPHAYRWSNFVYAAEHDFRAEKAAAENRIAAMQRDGHRLFDGSAETQAMIHERLGKPFLTLQTYRQSAERQPEVITDQNMITEYRYGRGL